MRFIRINGELAEIVPLEVGRAKLVYLACEPEGRLPTEVEYRTLDLDAGDRVGRIRLKGTNVLLIEGVQPRLLDALDPRKIVRELLAKIGFKRSHASI